MVKGFFGEYRFLSNFWPAKVIFDGVTYPTVENAYQAAKVEKHLRFGFLSSPGEAKKLGQTLTLRPGWKSIKLEIMYKLCQQKFSQSPLKEKLLATEGLLEETNDWGDRYWGVCDGIGENHLGKILMRIREELSCK